MQSYWGHVAAMAARESWTLVVGLGWIPLVILVVTTGLTALFYGKTKGWGAMRDQLLWLGLSAFSAAIVFTVMFVLSLARTPFLLHKAATEQAQAAESARSQALSELADVRSRPTVAAIPGAMPDARDKRIAELEARLGALARRTDEIKRQGGASPRWDQGAAGEPDDREQRKARRAVVARWLTDGDAIKAECDSLRAKPELQAKAGSWAKSTSEALKLSDPGYAAMFHDPGGPEYSRSLGGTSIPEINNRVWNWVNLRTEALNRILERMPQ